MLFLKWNLSKVERFWSSPTEISVLPKRLKKDAKLLQREDESSKKYTLKDFNDLYCLTPETV